MVTQQPSRKRIVWIMIRRRQRPQQTQLGAKILEVISRQQPPGLGLKEIIQATGIARSSVQRYLNMLRAEGLVHAQRRRWYPGPPLTSIPALRPPSQLILGRSSRSRRPRSENSS